MKRIWFKEKYHMSLRAGLELITESELEIFGHGHCKNCGHLIIKSGLKYELGKNKYYHGSGDVLSYPSCLKPKCRCSTPEPSTLCPKIYTTRTRRMKGEYYVVEGSRFKAKPVEPRIEFKVEKSFELNLSLESLHSGGTWIHHTLIQQETTVPLIQKIKEVFNMPSDYSFPELDLGYRNATFDDLKNELLKLNPKATLDTPFYVNRLASIGAEVTGGGK